MKSALALLALLAVTAPAARAAQSIATSAPASTQAATTQAATTKTPTTTSPALGQPVSSASTSSKAPALAQGAASMSSTQLDRRTSRILDLDPKRTNVVFIVHTTIGFATVLKLPDVWTGTPVCGDCVFGDAKPLDGGQPLYRLDVDAPARTMTLKPIRIPGVQPEGNVIPPDAFTINVAVNLESGMTVVLTLQLELDATKADAYVEFRLPAEATTKAQRTKLERELTEQFDARVKAATQDALLSALMTGARCREFAGRPTREDSLVVRLKQLCKLNGYLYVVFEAQNRGKNETQLRDAALTSTAGVASTLTKLEKPLLRQNERTLGIAAVELLDPTLPPQTFTLTVSEDGAKNRVVTVEGIEF